VAPTDRSKQGLAATVLFRDEAIRPLRLIVEFDVLLPATLKPSQIHLRGEPGQVARDSVLVLKKSQSGSLKVISVRSMLQGVTTSIEHQDEKQAVVTLEAQVPETTLAGTVEIQTDSAAVPLMVLPVKLTPVYPFAISPTALIVSLQPNDSEVLKTITVSTEKESTVLSVAVDEEVHMNIAWPTDAQTTTHPIDFRIDPKHLIGKPLTRLKAQFLLRIDEQTVSGSIPIFIRNPDYAPSTHP